jgi:hypothetical protein
MRIALRDEARPAIAVIPAESLEFALPQGQGFVSCGIGHEEVEVDLCCQRAEESQGLRIDAQQYGAELVTLALDGAA